MLLFAKLKNVQCFCFCNKNANYKSEDKNVIKYSVCRINFCGPWEYGLLIEILRISLVETKTESGEESKGDINSS